MTSTRSIHPDFQKWADAQKSSSKRGVSRGSAQQTPDEFVIGTEDLTVLTNVSAKMSSGFFRPTKRTEVVWVEGDSELEVSIDQVETEVGNGVVSITVPVRCDQTGSRRITMFFAVGRPDFPAGAYAATLRRPVGPPIIIDVWGDALVAFAWEILLTVMVQAAGAAGKDQRGTRFVPGVVTATTDGLVVKPIERHRFFGSTGLLVTNKLSRDITKAARP